MESINSHLSRSTRQPLEPLESTNTRTGTGVDRSILDEEPQATNTGATRRTTGDTSGVMMTDTGDWSGATSNTRYWSHKRQEILLEQRRQILETGGVEPQATDTVSSGCCLWLQWLLLVAPVSVVSPVSAVSHSSCCGSSICRSWLQYLLPAVAPVSVAPVAVDGLQWLSIDSSSCR